MVQTISTPPVATASSLRGKSQNPLDTDTCQSPALADETAEVRRAQQLARAMHLQPNYCAERKPTQTPSRCIRRSSKDEGGTAAVFALLLQGFPRKRMPHLTAKEPPPQENGAGHYKLYQCERHDPSHLAHLVPMTPMTGFGDWPPLRNNSEDAPRRRLYIVAPFVAETNEKLARLTACTSTECEVA